MPDIPAEFFKAYDIRGVVGAGLDSASVRRIGAAIGVEARARGQGEIVVGRDGRLSSPGLADALAGGLAQAGMRVVDLGRVTTPMAYFAAHHLGCGNAVMVTGSHNPPEYNGLKIVLAGEALCGEAIQVLRRRLDEAPAASATDEASAEEAGRVSHRDIGADYLARITGDVRLARPMSVVVDAGNGVAGAVAPALYRALGCRVEELYCEVDGRFPHHHPDPSVPANLTALIERVRASDAEIGLAFDGDGDRLGVVAKDGRVIYPDRQLMLFADEVLARSPGGVVIFDVKSSRNLDAWIRARGGHPMLWKTGHSVIKARMRETGAVLAGEMSGHVFFGDRWYGFDDGVYAGARLLEILSRQADCQATLRALPDSLCTPELHIPLREGEPRRCMEELARFARFPEALRVVSLDGLRVEYADGFGLLRASNTTPSLVLRFEADDAPALRRIQEDFRRLLLAHAPDLRLPF